MKEIKLSRGKVALVDDADFVWLTLWKWSATRIKNNWYALRRDCVTGRTIYMHAVILGVRGGDHKDGNGLNNQRNNLRIATNSQNGANARKASGCTSRFKGVSWNKNSKRWITHFGPANARRHVGSFLDEVEAAKAYDACAAAAFGEFAKLNFPISSTEIVN